MKLPINCSVDYIEDFLTDKEANDLYSTLIENYQIDKSRLVIQVSGKSIQTDSFKILFCTESLKEQNSHPEEIHGKSFVWSGHMALLKEKVETSLKREFEIAMCLYYPNGTFFAPYHDDQETSGNNTIIPSISLGEVRVFSFKDKSSQEEYNLDLGNGSIIVMGAHCQGRYTHSLLQNSDYKNGRINITFRDANFQ